MTAKEAIRRADELRPNALGEEQKAAWIFDLDGQIADMMQTVPTANTFPDLDVTLLMSAPHEEIYPLYLVCKIDFYNQEMNMYANDRAIYEGAMQEAAAWYRRNNRPVSHGVWRCW